jgi:hypothetical protein
VADTDTVTIVSPTGEEREIYAASLPFFTNQGYRPVDDPAVGRVARAATSATTPKE